MPAIQSHRTPAEVARLGSEIFDRTVRPVLRPEDDGKFVAIDIRTADHEIDEDDYAAVTRLRTRHPSAEVWLGRVGQPAAYRLRKSSGGAVLADGSVRQLDIYAAEVEWDGQWRSVLVSAVGDEALVGMRLLKGHEVRMAVVPGGAVEITPLP